MRVKGKTMTESNPNPESTAELENIGWIRTVVEGEASGYVKNLYETFRKQRGWVPNILKSTSIRPDITRGWVSFFNTLMYGPSGLTRIQREMMAVVVSAGNQCHY
ncbi:carboxymuconolactone decarboxylase family protein [Acidobacteria bacterium AH-259-D05]|nr:carboxymuconolactone decarboxylase family protein [Acidobacteria bacterium AH-259-D05]